MIAIIAGTGNLPKQACKSFLAAEKDFFVISLFPEDNMVVLKEELPQEVPVIHKPFYKVKTILEILQEHNTKQVLFIGKVDKQNLLKKFKLDWYGIKVMASLATKSDMSIMNKIGEILEEHGIEVIHQNTILNTLLVPPGVLTGKLTPELEASIAMGIELTTKISACDVGQTVVIKDKMVMAVEAIEGTDACIKRGIELGKQDVVVCKGIQPHHNKQFDLPTIGSATLASIKPGEIKAIAWQSQNTFIADLEQFVARAKELGITLVSV